MGTGDYMCVTLRGGAPWGFSLREGEGDTYRPFLVSQVEEGGRAFLAGVREGDEVVSLNGEPCADLPLVQAFALIDTSIDCLQLLVKRLSTIPPEEAESEETDCGGRDSTDETLKRTTLHIFTPQHGSQSPRELRISECQDEAYYGELGSDTEIPRGPQLLYTELHVPSSGNGRGKVHDFQENDGAGRQRFSPGAVVEFQVSLSDQALDDVGFTSLGSAHGIDGELSNKEAVEMIHPDTVSHYVPLRQPLGQHGVVLGSPSELGKVELILQQPAASGAGRGLPSVGGPRVGGSVGSQSEGEEGGGQCEGDPGSFTVSFEIPSGEAAASEEHDSDSEGDQDKPNKHHAKHARLRRSESLSEKHVKEVKSKCKRIALLLTAAPANPNNKGVLMFKKHRQRAKKYTLVSYGTGEDEPEYSDEEDEIENQETHAVEFTLVAPNGSKIDKHFLTNAHSTKGVLTINWDNSLLEIERNLNKQAQMEQIETKGKGASMFAQRRQRMDEISAEHDELRRQGIPVEAVSLVENKREEHSYTQSTTEGHAYMDVSTHQQGQPQQNYQQYQERQYYEQQQNYQPQYQQQYQQQQYEQQHYQQQQMYQQQQQQPQREYHQEQQQMQNYSTNINGVVQHQTSEMQSSFNNRIAKPFSVENMQATSYSPAMSRANQDLVSQGEQIASRDERISTPASRTGLLSDSRRRNAGKPMFTFKEAPKVSPNPALLNLLNKKEKKGFESGPEEDYLSLGAEACNFLQSQQIKHKTPPPVAPKPVIHPNSPPWSPQIEGTNEDMPQQAENSVSTPAVAPTTETTPAPELEPTLTPAPELSTPAIPQATKASAKTEGQHTWTPPEPESQQPLQQPLQVTAQEENNHVISTLQPEPAPVPSWAPTQARVQHQPSTSSWQAAQAQPQEAPHSQSPPQPPWITRQHCQSQAQPEPPTNTWTPQIQPPQAQAQTQAPPCWTQPQEQPQSQAQVQPPWAHLHEQPNLQQLPPTWGRSQESMQQQPQTPWAHPSQTDSTHQPPWVQQPQQKSQVQPPWAQPVQPESQPQPPWAPQPQHPTPQQTWPQAQAPGQPQPPWVSAQPQHQPPINAWPASKTQDQVQPPWIQAAQPQPLAQPAAILNQWPPVPAQAQSPPAWAQQTGNSWAPQQNQAQPQPPWVQPLPPQPASQSNWQQSPSKPPPQPPMNTWPPPQAQPQAPLNTWAPQSQEVPVNVSLPMVNTRPSPKPWQPTQNQTPPPPPQRMHSLTIGQRVSPPINPMATVLNPSSCGSAFEMPAVRGKGADMFAKRQSRMEKYVVDSETVKANKTSRPESPAASLPNEWKYTPNVRAPPSRAYNPILSPSYPPAATKLPPASSPSTKANKKGKEKQKPAPKPLNVLEVMKHQPYQLNSSLFTFGPATEAAKAPEPKPDWSPPNPPVENQPIRYEQMALPQPGAPFNTPYPQQVYGMPMQPTMHDGHYQQNSADVYPPTNPYQQPPGGSYQQAYNQQTYKQPAPPAYHPQAPQSPNPSYQHAPQALYQPANSPPYLTPPSVPYQPQPPSVYVAPSFPIAARPESAAGGSTAAAPKPRFTAKKSSAQVWKPTAVDKE